jgi:hypothetical protein
VLAVAAFPLGVTIPTAAEIAALVLVLIIGIALETHRKGAA